MKLYQKVKIPDFDIKQKELLDLVKRKFSNTSVLGYYDPSKIDMAMLCPSLYSYVLKNSIEPVRLFRIYNSPPGQGLGPHIDGGEFNRSPIGLNLPILNCSNSLMKWWDESTANKVTGNFGWNGIPATKILNPGELKCLDQVEIDCPTFVRTDFIHSVENYNSGPRIVLSIRWNYDKIRGQNFEDVFKYDDVI